MKGGGNSPALERYRLAKAEREELELSIKRGELVDIALVKDKLGAIALLMRERFEAMERAGGAGVAKELESLIDDMKSAVRRWFPQASGDDAEPLEP
jgi:hypothetical protein